MLTFEGRSIWLKHRPRNTTPIYQWNNLSSWIYNVLLHFTRHKS